ncbi:hypothetical protein [Lactiplantibacillus plantarum]|nr:hypothetical protein [Lactiplantibacillus plantarum]
MNSSSIEKFQVLSPNQLQATVGGKKHKLSWKINQFCRGWLGWN